MTLRHVTQLHEHPALVAFACSAVGRAVVWLVATCLLLPYRNPLVLLVSLLVAALLVAPRRRSEILAAGAVVGLLAGLTETAALDPILSGASAAVLVAAACLVGAALYVCFLAARNYRRLPPLVQRSPQLTLHAIAWPLLAATLLLRRGEGPVPAACWLAIVTIPFLLWRCGYLLLAGRRGRVAGTRFRDHLLYLWPAWGGSNVPYGKGRDYLSRVGATTDVARARAQLGGIKLLVLAWIWRGAAEAMSVLVYGESPTVRLLAVPRLPALIAAGPSDDVPLLLAWTSVVLQLVVETLWLAAGGHVIIGCLRLFGFAAFRNTYKPLLSQSVVEFWNRYYYYFKELLVEFFFFPVYAAYFKRRPRLRLLAATMAAAFLGNVYHHVLRDLVLLKEDGVAGAWALLAPRIVYAFLLAAGIYVSMQREQQRRGHVWPRGSWSAELARLRRIAGVWLFFGVIHIWIVRPPTLTFAQRTTFFLSLLGLA